MHELSVTSGLVDMVNKEAVTNNANKVVSVKLKVGKLSCLVPEIVKDYFQLLSEGTASEGAELIIEKFPGRIHCNDCDEDFEIEDFRIICPKCKGRNADLIEGRESYIDSIVVE
ncbi:MAG: hydrogenase maturation nickel metallochaperone HypA [Lachnospiraceae bacterium]|nr:hydrogenase maturation nickel metallochaperone HypA [Lachnospiraceae bacterium]